MYILIIVIMLITAVLLGLVILIQNPKGGGLNASLGSVGNQVFGAKKSTNIVEKATWYLALAIFVLSLISVTQINVSNDEGFEQDSKTEKLIDEIPVNPINTNNGTEVPQ